MNELCHTRVMFRVWKKGGDVIALLLDINYNSGDTGKPGYVMSYQHIGQHGEADFQSVLSSTRPAQPDEYASLQRELKGRGYKLRVVKRNLTS